MILLTAVAVGLICGLLRAKVNGEKYRTVNIQWIVLVLVAFIPQFFAFSFYPTQKIIPDNWIPFILIGSQIMLLIFAWENRHIKGFWLLGLGLLLNFTVILVNGGFMPLLPENAERLLAPGSTITLDIGKRAGLSKDMVLPRGQTRLWFLGDVFMLPEWLNYPLAFSIGDIVLGMGAFYILWELGRPQINPKEVSP